MGDCLLKLLTQNTTMKRQLRSPRKFDSKCSLLLTSLLQGMITKRKSYAFQLVKQFFLFPDESESSERTVSRYDRLIFSDEQLHTLFKKLETKLIENKIWAFLNLKALPYIRAARNMERPIKRLKKRVDHQHIVSTFECLKTYAYTKITQTARSPRRAETSSYTHIKITETETKEEVIRVDNKRSNNHVGFSGIRRLEGSRSRSGSITRFQYDVENGKRLLLNGEVIPCTINIKRSESPLREPEYIKITKSPSGSEDVRYVGLTRNELQKRQNLKLEYNNAPLRHPKSREDSRSRIIYVERSIVDCQNQVICTHCSNIHSGSQSCTPQSEKRIKRLRSSSKKQLASQGYLQHLNS